MGLLAGITQIIQCKVIIYTEEERPLFLGLYLMIVHNYKTIIVLNKSLNPAYPIAVVQAKL